MKTNAKVQIMSYLKAPCERTGKRETGIGGTSTLVLVLLTCIWQVGYSATRHPLEGVILHTETLYRSDNYDDNWCMTWASNDSQITSMCDGDWLGGKRPYHNHLYRIIGGPDKFSRRDLPNYPDLSGKSGSWFGYGIVSVDGILYSVISKTPGESWSGPFRGIKLLKSPDHGKTWCRVNQRGQERKLGPMDDARNQRLGICLQFVFNEAETENKAELGADLTTERLLFYGEMAARFGHHNAILWNLCEEYNLQLQLSPRNLNAFARYISDLDPYDHPITVHHAGDPVASWKPFPGKELFSITSLQIGNKDIEPVVETFRRLTREAGRPIPIAIDEFTVTTNNKPWLPEDDIDALRIEKLWPAYLSGGQARQRL
jgi:hypothetical protein